MPAARAQAVGAFLVSASTVPRSSLRRAQDQESQRHQLGGEGLGRGDADLRPGMGHQHQVGFTHDRTLGHVADRQPIFSEGLARDCFSAASVSIGLAGLAEMTTSGAGHHHVLAVAVLARDVGGTGRPSTARTSNARPDRRGSWCRRRSSAPRGTAASRSTVSGPSRLGSSPFAGHAALQRVGHGTAGCSWISLSMKCR
jgi:hypothetical protein